MNLNPFHGISPDDELPIEELIRLSEGWLQELIHRHPTGRPVQLIWKGLRVSAGMAYYPSHRIALSNRVLKTPRTTYETLVHEYAHLLAFTRGQALGKPREGAGHGPMWQQAMLELGATPKVRHNYAVERNRSKQTFCYRCERCRAEFTRSRRLKPGRVYVHVRCGGRLRLVNVELNKR